MAIGKLEEILGVISTGINKNPTLESESLLLTLFPMIQHGINISQSELKSEDAPIDKEYKKPSLAE